MNIERKTALVLKSPVDALSWDEALAHIMVWARRRESRYVCFCNVHSVVTASRDFAFRSVVEEADLAAPDGGPVAWMLRRLGFSGQQRINGPDLMWKYCQLAQSKESGVFLYGGSETTLSALQLKLRSAFPRLRIAGTLSPPFRPLTSDEDQSIVEQINGSGAGVVFVSLGCPKQELWMAAHRGRINAVMMGVGAAFDFHADTIRRAPKWMRDCGLEWFHRLVSEPRRLWKRYLVTNAIFLVLAATQLIMGSESRGSLPGSRK
jgi:N-acetylglucosaminyldiphosphoundecaprenol N-acetyl-beta-D-mannosaminyltransferase